MLAEDTTARTGGYTSALDIVGGALPSSEVPAGGDAEAPERPGLEDDIKAALIDMNGRGPLSLIHETVNASGPHVPEGVIVRRLEGWERAGIVRREGEAWILTDTARDEIERAVDRH